MGHTVSVFVCAIVWQEIMGVVSNFRVRAYFKHPHWQNPGIATEIDIYEVGGAKFLSMSALETQSSSMAVYRLGIATLKKVS